MTARVRVRFFGRLLVQLGADLLVLVGICGVFIWAWAWADGAVYQHVQQAAFDRASLVPPVAGMAKKNPKADPKIVGKLEVARIGMSVMVREGVDSTTLRRAAGRVPSSALPGQSGNVVILAHRDTFFRPLRRIAKNDVVTLRTVQKSFRYKVVSIGVVAPESASWRGSNRAQTLTLITCFPFDYVGPAPQRFIVTAKLVGAGEEKLPGGD